MDIYCIMSKSSILDFCVVSISLCLLLQGKLDEAEKYFLAALEEAKEGFGTRDPHVASSCNNLVWFL